MAEYPFHYDPPRVRISDSEIVVQKTMLRSIAIMFPRSRVAAVPNGQKRTRWQAQRAKAEGMSKGFSDLIITGRDMYEFRPLVAFCEIKAAGSMTPEQLDWMTWLQDNEHLCGVFRSDQTLCDKLREWGFR